MTFPEAIYSSAGVGAGIFVGCLLGLSIRKSGGKTDGLWKESVLATSLLAAMVAWVVFALVRFFIGG